MKCPPWPYLLLLPLLVVLLFGNCGGGVRGLLNSTGSDGRARLRSIIEHERTQRAAARKTLRGRARRDAFERIELRTNAQLDSALSYGTGPQKLRHRRGKLERQLFREPLPPARP